MYLSRPNAKTAGNNLSNRPLVPRGREEEEQDLPLPRLPRPCIDGYEAKIAEYQKLAKELEEEYLAEMGLSHSSFPRARK